MRTALDEVSPQLAFWRPAVDRHNIAEIAAHHAFCVHAVRERLSGANGDEFPLGGDADWFALESDSAFTWPAVEALVRDQQRDLVTLAEALAAGHQQPALAPEECFDQVLGITCHAIYHAGQIQLIKRLYPA